MATVTEEGDTAAICRLGTDGKDDDDGDASIPGPLVAYPGWKPEKLTFLPRAMLPDLTFEEQPVVNGGVDRKAGDKDENGNTFCGYTTGTL
jgi:hypothetical protein